MSWLIFKRNSGRILLVEGRRSESQNVYKVKSNWPAHNETAQSSNGPWPKGEYPWARYNLHPEMGLRPACYRTAYGCAGIHVFEVPNRSGMGIHAGRSLGQPDVTGGKTLGCIRVPANAMEVINRVHNTDPLEVVVVTD